MEQIIWLIIASAVPIDYESETFYYDSKEKEFFILGMFDYLLIGDHGGFEFQYSEEECIRLVEKIQRIDNQDPTLIEIPVLTIADRISFQQRFVNEHTSGEVQNHLLEIVSKQSYEHQLILDSAIPPESFDNLLGMWEEAKFRLAQTRALQFEQTYGVDLKEVSIWRIDKSRGVKKTAPVKVNTISKAKPWWKMW
ncbi:hypothetical protein [Pedobacter sp. GR22-10]|uniref:hypothetical protein n=1 Tax=Pedobacter sp. GR22-10 TaxID=2994472 RepID=UPI00224571D9|nr:hypothetical protein [Pedobacter sp. GR22-10]MCX2431107.1 hypothetical protein [Pedobacter sp. GR22-10]